MNRKEMIIVGIVLLLSFVGGAVATPSIQQVFVTNFPSNQHVTVTNPNLNVTVTNPTPPTVHTSAVDIDLFEAASILFGSGNQPGLQIWNIPTQSSSPEQNFTRAFSFAPSNGFIQVSSVALTVTFSGYSTVNGIPSTTDAGNVEINGQSSGNLVLPDRAASTSTTAEFLSGQGLHLGANMINIVMLSNNVVTIYEVHLTVEYTFLA